MTLSEINRLGFLCGLYWTHDTYFRHFRRLAIQACEQHPDRSQDIQTAWRIGWTFGFARTGNRPTEKRFPMPTLTLEEITLAHEDRHQ